MTLLASVLHVAAEPVLTTENVGVLTALIVALTGLVATIIGASNKRRVNDRQEILEELRIAKEALKDARREHSEEVGRWSSRVDELERRLVERDRQLNAADRIVIACRSYIAKLSALLIDRGAEVPPRPAELGGTEPEAGP